MRRTLLWGGFAMAAFGVVGMMFVVRSGLSTVAVMVDSTPIDSAGPDWRIMVCLGLVALGFVGMIASRLIKEDT